VGATCSNNSMNTKVVFRACQESDFAERQFVRRYDAHAALAGGDEDQFGAAADDADLDGTSAILVSLLIVGPKALQVLLVDPHLPAGQAPASAAAINRAPDPARVGVGLGDAGEVAHAGGGWQVKWGIPAAPGALLPHRRLPVGGPPNRLNLALPRRL